MQACQEESVNNSQKLMLPLEKLMAHQDLKKGECSPTPSTRSGASSRPFSWADLDPEDDDLTDDETPCNAVRTPKHQLGLHTSPIPSKAFPKLLSKCHAVPKSDIKPHVGPVTPSQTRRVQKVRSVVSTALATPTTPYTVEEDHNAPISKVVANEEVESVRCSKSVAALTAIYRRFDVDGDGLLSYKELAVFAEACGSQPLSTDEYAGLCQTLEAKLGRPLEEPRNGLTRAEFLETYRLCGDDEAGEEMIVDDYQRVFGFPLLL